MRIQHVERALIFIELPGDTDADVQAAWLSAFTGLVAEVSHPTVIIEAPAG